MSASMSSRIREMRESARMSPGELAVAVGVSESAVRNWEDGTSKPYRKNLLALADALGTSADYLSTGDGPMEVRRGSGSASAVGRTGAEGVKVADSHDATVVQRLKGEATIGINAHARNPKDASYERGYRDALMDVMHRVTELGVTPPASSPERVLDGDDAIEEAEQHAGGQAKEG